jgi:ketosteroid isomerase-like protein
VTGHAQVVRTVFDSFNAGDFEVRPETTHPDIEIVTETTRLAGEPYRGHEGVRLWIQETFEAFSEWTIAMDEVEELGPDRVLAVGTLHLLGRESGVTVDLPCAWIFDFEGSLCTRLETFPNRVDEARRAAGSA